MASCLPEYARNVRETHFRPPLIPVLREAPKESRILQVVRIIRFVWALLLEQNDEWVVPRARYMTLETIAPMGDDAVISLPAVAS
jgi:hypothetical protein